MMKKILSLALALMMLLSSVNFTYAASSYTDAEQEYINKVTAVNIMKGSNLGLELDRTLTRAEAATILIRLRGVSGLTGDLPKAETKFADVPATHWASGNINRAVEMGLVQGIGDNLFAPERLVTVAELVTMCVRAVGAGPAVELMGTKWPVNYMNFASEADITKNVYNSYTEQATRLTTVLLIGNTLEAKMWKYNSVLGQDRGMVETDDTILDSILKVRVYENAVITEIDLRDRTLSFEYEDGKTTRTASYSVDSNVNLAGYIRGLEVNVWYSTTQKDIILLAKPESTKRTVVSFESIESFVGINSNTGKNVTGVKLEINGKVKEYSFANSGEYIYNGTSKTWDYSVVGKDITDISFSALDDVKTNASGKIVLDGNKVKTMDTTVYEHVIVVERVSGETIYANTDALDNSGNTLNLKDKDLLIVDQDGNEIEISDVRKGDTILYVITSGSPAKYRLMVLDNVVEGAVKMVGTSYIRIGSKTYDIDDCILTRAEFKNMEINSEDEVELYLNVAGKVVGIKRVEGDVSTSYGIISYARSLKNKYGEIALELEVTYFDGNTTGTKELDLKKTDNKINKISNSSLEFGTTAEANGLGQALLGMAVKFRNGSKIEVEEVAFDIDVDVNSGDRATWVAAEDKLDAFKAASFDIDRNRVTGTGLSQTVRTNSLTKIAILKPGTGTDAQYKVKVEFADWDSLKSATYSGTDYFVAVAQNSTTGVVPGLVACLGNASLSKDYTANFGMVKAISNPDRNDLVTITIITSDGREKDFTIDESDLSGKGADIGMLMEYTASGSKLQDVDFTAEEAGRYQVNRFSSNTVKVAKIPNAAIEGDLISSTEVLDLSENILYVKSDAPSRDWYRMVEGYQDDIETISISNTDEITDLGTDVKLYINSNNEIAIIWYQR